MNDYIMERLTEKRNCEIFFYGPVYCKFSNENYIHDVLKREVKSPCYKDDYYNGGFVRETSLQQIYRKLSHLEDIEEDLGIDLITLFKALKNGFYWLYNDGKNRYIKFENEPRGIRLGNDNEWYILGHMVDISVQLVCPLKHYGDKSFGGWALTKEELE